MTITPDTKDWTWVLQRPCPECGLDTSTFAREDVAGLVRDVSRRWQALLTGPAEHRQRPTPDRWSALEYGCHVRDVFRLYDYRLNLMLTTDGPHYPNWDQDVTAVDDHYSEQDPETVAAELVQAGDAVAARFDTVSGDQWQRTNELLASLHVGQ